MADFSAVIRRAIDGLSTNTPEERGRIYARARATIQRQLDSLPEGMNRTIFEAQLVKIEDSILEIEQEYADAPSNIVPEDNTPITPENNLGSNPAQDVDQRPTDELTQQPPERYAPPAASANESTVSANADATPEDMTDQRTASLSDQGSDNTSSVDDQPVEPITPSTTFTANPPVSEPTSELTSEPTGEPESQPADKVVPEPFVAASTVQEKIAEVRERSAFDDVQKVAPTADESLMDRVAQLDPANPSDPGEIAPLSSAENAIDSELEIPGAPQSGAHEPDVPVIHTPIGEPVEKRFDETPTTDNDASLIDHAVSEIRSTLEEVTPSADPSSDPNLSFGFGEEALPEAPAPRPRRSPIVIIIALLLLVLAAVAFFIWRVGWQGIQDLLPQNMVQSEQVSEQIIQGSESSSVDTPEDSETQVDQNEATANSEEEVAAASGEVEKFTQRLNPDGSEIDAGPASDLIDGLPNEEGRSVASADVTDDANVDEPIIAQTDDGTPVLQKMFFYETSLGLEQQARYEGSIVWSEKTEADSEKSRPYIEAIIQVPERDLEITMTIKLNGDETLPVSHLIDLNFSLPENFNGGEIEQINEVKFKSSEEETGDRLEAISAKIDTSFFVVGLQNDNLDVVDANLLLMSQRGWIDIPISYTNGRKALITLEKGASGKVIFDKVLASWRQNPAQ